MRVLTHLRALEPLGGVELCVQQEATALAGRGHVFDIAHDGDGRLRPVFEALGFSLQGGHQADLEPRHPVRTAAAYARGARWARGRGADVLWLHRFEHITWGQAVARAAHLPLVCTLHGVPMYDRVRPLAAGVTHCVAVSQFVRDAWVDRGLPAERVSVIANAVPLEAYPFGGEPERSAARRALGLPADVPVVLCYGRTVVEKGLRELLQAWAATAADAGDGRVLLLLGDPDPSDDPELAPLLAALDPSSYRWTPASTDVLTHLHACDVVVFPTLLQEAFGRVVLEGMATGRPVLATRAGAVPEVLGPFDESLLVPAGDSRALAARLETLLRWRRDDPDLGRRASDWVRAHFPFGSHIDALEAVLTTAAATVGRGSSEEGLKNT